MQVPREMTRADMDRVTRDFATGCTVSGCHGSTEAAISAYTTASARIANLIADVTAQMGTVPAGELDPADGRFTVADGANFNLQLAGLPGSQVHNPFLIEQLLLATSDALTATYGGAPPAAQRGSIQSRRQIKVDGIGR